MPRNWTRIGRLGLRWLGITLMFAPCIGAAEEPSATRSQIAKQLSLWPEELPCSVHTSQRVEVNVTLGDLNRGLQTKIRPKESCEFSVRIEPFSTGLRNDDMVVNLIAASVGLSKGKETFGGHRFTSDEAAEFVVGQGDVRLSLNISRNYWPADPLSKAQQEQQHKIIISLSGKRADPRLSRLNQWFAGIGVSQLLVANWLCDFDTPLSKTCQEAAKEAYSIGFSRRNTSDKSSFERETMQLPENLLVNISDPTWRYDNEIPQLFIRINSSADRFGLMNFEKKFFERHKTSF